MSNLFTVPEFIRDFVTKSEDATGRLHPRKTKNNTTEEVKEWLSKYALTNREAHYIVKHNLTEIPVCPICGKRVDFVRGNVYCSPECSVKSELRAEHAKQTNLVRYGVEHTSQLQSVKDKTKETYLTKYGVEHPSQTKEFIEKRKATNRERYGVDAPMQSEEVKQRAIETNRAKYGTDWGLQSDEVKEKIKDTCIREYGNEYSIASESVRKKIKESLLTNLGVDNPFKSAEVREKREQTLLERYGVKSNFSLEENKQKIRDTCQERYGVDHPSQSLEYKAKHREKQYSTFIRRLSVKHLELVSPREDYVDCKPLQFRCLKCGEIFTMDESNPQRIHCSKCDKTKSNPEKDVCDFIRSIYDGEIVENTRTVIPPKELDIYLSEKNLAIEFDGMYWHSSEYKDSTYHQEKTLACREKEIRLIHIFEWEWINDRPKIESLLKTALGIYEKRIYARKCEVRSIDSKMYREFLEENHLQGAVNSSIRLGLFHEDELVSVIGFGKSRFKRGETELHRYCVKNGYLVIGGFSKLIKASEMTDFISYVDLSHFDGRGYKSLGFEEIGVTEPSYRWVNVYGEALSRLATQKHKLGNLLKEGYDETLTEVENMEMNNYSQVYDSGNLKVRFIK